MPSSFLGITILNIVVLIIPETKVIMITINPALTVALTTFCFEDWVVEAEGAYGLVMFIHLKVPLVN